jgi:hypothetical protein
MQQNCKLGNPRADVVNMLLALVSKVALHLSKLPKVELLFRELGICSYLRKFEGSFRVT